MSVATHDLLSLMTAPLTYTVRDFIKEILLENNDVNNSRRRFLAGATSVVGGAGLVGAAIPFFSSWKTWKTEVLRAMRFTFSKPILCIASVSSLIRSTMPSR